MRPSKITRPLLAAAVILCAASLSPVGAQEERTRPAPADEVVRIKTELVQTDVTIVDRQGRFVAGLGREQFELTVGGKPRTISFFEPFLAQAAVEKGTPPPGKTGARTAVETQTARAASVAQGERGRTILFFVDDLHLAPENLIRARKALLQFVDTEMSANDQAAVVSTSGQVGFLQQLTDNPAVLREAAARLSNRRNTETYAGKVPISEYDASQVAQGFNHQLFNYLVKATAAEYQTDEVTAANVVRNRVHQIAEQSRVATTNTLGALEALMRSSAQLPGRKVVFFISDGFVTDPRSTNALERLRGVTKTAAEVGAVIYTMDARGTFVNIYTDASQNPYPDFTGSVSRNVFAERTGPKINTRAPPRHGQRRPPLRTHVRPALPDRCLQRCPARCRNRSPRAQRRPHGPHDARDQIADRLSPRPCAPALLGRDRPRPTVSGQVRASGDGHRQGNEKQSFAAGEFRCRIDKVKAGSRIGV